MDALQEALGNYDGNTAALILYERSGVTLDKREAEIDAWIEENWEDDDIDTEYIASLFTGQDAAHYALAITKADNEVRTQMMFSLHDHKEKVLRERAKEALGY